MGDERGDALMDKNGGPAFPVRYEGPGMSLRDFFAAAALQGLIASRTDRSTHWHPDDDSNYCFRIADSMLKARES